jgi:hypothetical protein
MGDIYLVRKRERGFSGHFSSFRRWGRGGRKGCKREKVSSFLVSDAKLMLKRVE